MLSRMSGNDYNGDIFERQLAQNLILSSTGFFGTFFWMDKDHGKMEKGQETVSPINRASIRSRSSETAVISGEGGFRATV